MIILIKSILIHHYRYDCFTFHTLERQASDHHVWSSALLTESMSPKRVSACSYLLSFLADHHDCSLIVSWFAFQWCSKCMHYKISTKTIFSLNHPHQGSGMANWSCSTRLCCCCCWCGCQSVILKGSCVMQMLWSGFQKNEVGREVCRRMFSKERRKENRVWRNKTRNHTGRSLYIRNYRLSIFNHWSFDNSFMFIILVRVWLSFSKIH